MANLTNQLVKSISVYKYSVPFEPGVKIRDVNFTRRNGVLIKVTDYMGRIVWGEIAPISNSIADIDMCVREILNLKCGVSTPSFLEILNWTSIPAVKFGLYGAMKNLEWNVRLNSEHIVQLDHFVNVNALLIDEHGFFSKIEQLYEKGFKVFKLKIDEKVNYKDLVSRLEKIRIEGLGLIVDFNRNFELGTAVRVANDLSGIGYLMYIEDPVKRIGELELFIDNTEVNIGVDEFLLSDWKIVEGYLEGYRDRLIMVVKPSVLFGTECWDRVINDPSLRKVFTSCWEIGVGTRTVLMISYEINGGEVHTGVNTYSYIKDDICMPHLDVEKPKITIREIVTPISIDETKLEYLGEVNI